MAIVRYSWLKVIKTDLTPLPSPTPSTTDFSLWSGDAGGAARFITEPSQRPALADPPDPTVRLVSASDEGFVEGSCVECPPAAPMLPRALFAMQSPPLPDANGWSIEAATGPDSLSPACVTDPHLAFVIRPVEGTYDDAVRWMNSPDGADWCRGAATAVLLTCVVQI